MLIPNDCTSRPGPVKDCSSGTIVDRLGTEQYSAITPLTKMSRKCPQDSHREVRQTSHSSVRIPRCVGKHGVSTFRGDMKRTRYASFPMLLVFFQHGDLQIDFLVTLFIPCGYFRRSKTALFGTISPKYNLALAKFSMETGLRILFLDMLHGQTSSASDAEHGGSRSGPSPPSEFMWV